MHVNDTYSWFPIQVLLLLKAQSGEKAIVYGMQKTGKELYNILKETFVLANVYELTIESRKVSLYDTFEHLTKNTLFIHGHHLEIIK